MKIIQHSLGMTNPFLTIGESLSPPNFLLQRKFNFPPLISSTLQSPSFIQQISLYDSKQLNTSWEDFPNLDVNNLMMEEASAIPFNNSETEHIVNEIKNNPDVRQTDSADKIDTKKINRSVKKISPKATKVSQDNQKKVKSKTSEKEFISKKSGQKTTVKQKVERTYDTPIVQAALTKSTTPNPTDRTVDTSVHTVNPKVDVDRIDRTVDTPIVQTAIAQLTTPNPVSTADTVVENEQASPVAVTSVRQPTLDSPQTSFPQDINFNNQGIQPSQSTPNNSVNPTVDVDRIDRTVDTPIVQTAIAQPTIPNPVSTSDTAVENEQDLFVAKIFPQQPTLNSPQTSFPQDTSFNNQGIQPSQSTPNNSANPTVEVNRTERTVDTPIVQTAIIQPATSNPVSTSDTAVENEQASPVATTSIRQPTLDSPQTSFPQDTSFNNQGIQPSQSTPNNSVNPTVEVNRTERTVDTPIVQTAIAQPATSNPVSTSDTAVENEQASPVAITSVRQPTLDSPQTSFPQDTSFNNQGIQPSQSTPNNSVNPTVGVDRTERTADTPIVQTALAQPTTSNPVPGSNTVVENEQDLFVAKIFPQQPTLDSAQISFPQDINFNNQGIQPAQSTPIESVNFTVEIDRTERTADTPIAQTALAQPTIPNPISTSDTAVENEQASPVATTSVRQPTLNSAQTSFPQNINFNNQDIQPSQSTPNESVNSTVEIDRTERTADTPIVQTALAQPTIPNPISTSDTAVENEQASPVATTSVRQPTLNSAQISFPQDINFNNQGIQPAQSTPIESVNSTVEIDRTERTADTPIVQTALAQPTIPNPISTSDTAVENEQASPVATTSVRQPTLNSAQTSFPQDINFNNQDIQPSQSTPNNSVNPTVDADRTERTADTPIVQTALAQPATPNPISTSDTAVENEQASPVATTSVRQPTLDSAQISFPQDINFNNQGIQPAQSTPIESVNSTVEIDRTERTADTPIAQTAIAQPTIPNPISTSDTAVENEQASPVATTSVRQPTLDSAQISFPQDINFNNQGIQPAQSTPIESVNSTVEIDRTERTADTPIIQTAIAQPTTPNSISTSDTAVENEQASSVVTTSVRQPTLNSAQTSFPQDINFNNQGIQSSQSTPNESVNPTVEIDRTERTADTSIVQTAIVQPTTSNPVPTSNTVVENEQDLFVAKIFPQQPTLDSPQTSFPQDINFNNQGIQPAQSTPTESVNPTVEIDRTERTADTPIVETGQDLPDLTVDSLPPPQGYAVGGQVVALSSPNKQQIAASDTVPAMLTPGEFVVNAKDAQKNLNLLKQINNGNTISNYLQTSSLSREIEDRRQEAEKNRAFFKQQKNTQLGLPKMLVSLGSSSLQLKTENLNLSTLSSLKSNSRENKMVEVNQSMSHYSLSPLIFKKQVSPKDSSSHDSDLPSQWSSIEELAKGNSLTTNSIGFTSSKPIGEELTSQNLANSLKSKSSRFFTHQLPEIKSFAKGGQVTASQLQMSGQPSRETVEQPLLPTSGVDDRSSTLFETLAHEIYYWLRQRLEVEQERYGYYSGRGRIPW